MTQPDLARLEGLLVKASSKYDDHSDWLDDVHGYATAHRELANYAAYLPALLARVWELRGALSSIHAARLRKDGSDHGYGWNITALNQAVDAALPLIGKEAPSLDPRTAHIAENADRVAQHMGCRFNLNKETPDADR